ncbi:MAG: class I SAM-dependent methyltransferase [Candidatus Falkowbacteria bacterium]|nr:class I SAM-dependent methyltransferase [Candidatus Falkowbacteria bacterium]
MLNSEDFKKEKIDYNERFSGILGSDYNLFEKSVPWHEELQNTIKETISNYCSLNDEAKEFKAIDAGCGTGITTIRILDADKRIKVIAIDNEEKTLKQAEEALKDKVDRIDFIKDDLLSALEKVEDGSANIFASAYVIHNLPIGYREKFFKEIARVLKSGGLFINADKYARDDESQQKEDLEEQIKDFNIYDKINRPDIKEEWTKHYHEDEKIQIKEGEQKAILKELGFDNVKTIFRKRMEAIILATKK